MWTAVCAAADMRCGASFLALVSLALAADPKVELGRRLFMDPTVSRSGRISCASCHHPEHGFSDALSRSEDDGGLTVRHSQPLLDLEGARALHWDGEFGSVEEVIMARIGSRADAGLVVRNARTRRFEAAREAGLDPDEDEFTAALDRLPYYGDEAMTRGDLRRRLCEDGRYDQGFEDAFGFERVSRRDIVAALDAYVRSIRSGPAPFDRFHAGDEQALAADARRGFHLFTGSAGCASCHMVEGKRPLFTDGGLHNTGVAFRFPVRGRVPDPGARGLTFVAADAGKFKTPSLRDVARRAPYMHDGSFKTLEDVVDYYASGGTKNPHLDPLIRPLRLSGEDVADIVAFLRSLTSDDRPGIGPTRVAPRRVTLRVVDLVGNLHKGFPIDIHPAGDRLEGAGPATPQTVLTDVNGEFSFEFPAWTHVRLASANHEIHYDWLIPDCVRPMTVIAAPKDTVALRLDGFGKYPKELLASHKGRTVARFRYVRDLKGDAALYVAPRRAGKPLQVKLEKFPIPVVLDLSGGWAEPLSNTLEE